MGFLFILGLVVITHPHLLETIPVENELRIGGIFSSRGLGHNEKESNDYYLLEMVQVSPIYLFTHTKQVSFLVYDEGLAGSGKRPHVAKQHSGHNQSEDGARPPVHQQEQLPFVQDGLSGSTNKRLSCPYWTTRSITEARSGSLITLSRAYFLNSISTKRTRICI